MRDGTYCFREVYDVPLARSINILILTASYKDQNTEHPIFRLAHASEGRGFGALKLQDLYSRIFQGTRGKMNWVDNKVRGVLQPETIISTEGDQAGITEESSESSFPYWLSHLIITLLRLLGFQKSDTQINIGASCTSLFWKSRSWFSHLSFSA
jgi:hypothetical protein